MNSGGNSKVQDILGRLAAPHESTLQGRGLAHQQRREEPVPYGADDLVAGVRHVQGAELGGLTDNVMRSFVDAVVPPGNENLVRFGEGEGEPEATTKMNFNRC